MKTIGEYIPKQRVRQHASPWSCTHCTRQRTTVPCRTETCLGFKLLFRNRRWNVPYNSCGTASHRSSPSCPPEESKTTRHQGNFNANIIITILGMRYFDMYSSLKRNADPYKDIDADTPLLFIHTNITPTFTYHCRLMIDCVLFW